MHVTHGPTPRLSSGVSAIFNDVFVCISRCAFKTTSAMLLTRAYAAAIPLSSGAFLIVGGLCVGSTTFCTQCVCVVCNALKFVCRWCVFVCVCIASL